MEIKIQAEAFRKIEILKNRILPFIREPFEEKFEFDDDYADYDSISKTLSIDMIIDGVSIPFKVNGDNMVLITTCEEASDFDFQEMTEAEFWKALYFFRKFQS